VVAVYLTDSLKKDGLRNAKISNADFQGGSLTSRFRAYARTDSPDDDRYTAGTRASYKEWYVKWTIVAPVR
jgi:hypothetical protein